MAQQVIEFLSKHQITHVDEHTYIISEYDPSLAYSQTNFDESSLTAFLMADSRKLTRHTADNNGNTLTSPCYLVKDVIIDQIGQNQENDNNQSNQANKKILTVAVQTLSIHQQLSNKYILTLLHYQIFTKNVTVVGSNTSSPEKYCHQNTNANTNTNTNNRNMPKDSNVQLQTRISQSMYREESIDGQSFSRSRFQDKDRASSQFSLFKHKASRISNGSNMQSNLNTYNTNVSINNNTTQCPKTAIRAIYEYGKISLKQEIKNRIVSSTQFQEEELWAIIATLVQALSYLQNQGIVYGVLGTDKIFINNSLVKLLDPSATATDPMLIQEGRLYSPEILNEQQVDLFKSDVYVMGLVIIECGLLVDLSKQIQANLQKYLQVFRTGYSKQMTDIISLCLRVRPTQRPSFEQLKHYLSKQLDMNDFESAYQNGGKVLKPMTYDQQDYFNPSVNEIQYQYQECNYDVLYESISEQQLKVSARKKNLSDLDRARMRYLGANYQYQANKLAQQNGSDRNRNHKKVHSQQHRHTSSSPMQTRRNNKNPNINNNNNFSKNHNTNSNGIPNLDMAISESVYPEDGPIFNKHCENIDKTNRKGLQSQRQSNFIRNDKQNIEQQRTVPNSNQKIKKTKLIKQKLVRNQQTLSADQTFAPKNLPKSSNGSSSNRRNDNASFNKYETYLDKNININKYNNESIRQQNEQQSQSSCLYFNTINSKSSSEKPNNGVGNSQVSAKSESSSNLKSSSLKSSERYANIEQKSYSHHNSKLQRAIEHDQLFTDPNLLQTIKDDLARISTTKNINSKTNGGKDKQKWFK